MSFTEVEPSPPCVDPPGNLDPAFASANSRDRYNLFLWKILELSCYILFVASLLTVTYYQKSPNMYHLTSALQDLLLDEPFGDEDGRNFRSIGKAGDLWEFLMTSLVEAVCTEDGRRKIDSDSEFVYSENMLVRRARIRQVRNTANVGCRVPEVFQKVTTVCYATSTPTAESSKQFSKGSSLQENEGSFSYTKAKVDTLYRGNWATYTANGYMKELPLSKEKAKAEIRDLRNHGWISRDTRAIFIDLVVYNANVNLFCIIQLIAEFPTIGGVFPYWNFDTVRLLNFTQPFDNVVFILQIILVVMCGFYIVQEIYEVYKHRLVYLYNFWNVFDFLVIIMTITVVAYNLHIEKSMVNMLKKLIDDKQSEQEYLEFDQIARTKSWLNIFSAWNAFFAVMKVFKFTSFNKTMTQLARTLSTCAMDLLSFGVMVSVVFLAFALLSWLLFGDRLKEYDNLFRCVFSLFRILLGDFDYHSLKNANRNHGPIFFVLYVFVMFFILLNIFMAIVNEAYTGVREEMKRAEGDHEFVRYIFRRLKKKVKINILAEMDMNKDNVIEAGEWQAHAEGLGIEEGLADEMFERMDADRSGAIEKHEQTQFIGEDVNK